MRNISNNANKRSHQHIKNGKYGKFSLTRETLEKLCDNNDDRCAITKAKFVRRPDEPNSL